MTSMETINETYIDGEDLGVFVRWFNRNIQIYGRVTVAYLMQDYIGHWEENYTDYTIGWTKMINAKDNFEIIYPDYGNRLPYFRLKLPNYETLIEQA